MPGKGRGQCERSQHPGGRGSPCKAGVSAGEERARVKGHSVQGGECRGEGTSCTRLKGQCSGRQGDGANARLQGRCGGREQGSGQEDNAGEGAVPGEGIVQAFLFPVVTSWQIPKLKRPSSGDIQQGRAGPGRPGGPRVPAAGARDCALRSRAGAPGGGVLLRPFSARTVPSASTRAGRAGLGWAAPGQGSRSLAGVAAHAFQFSQQEY